MPPAGARAVGSAPGPHVPPGDAGCGRLPWTPCAAAAAVALVVRLTALAAMREGNPLLRSPTLDDAMYVEAARAMSEGRAEPWFLAPLHPGMLSVLGRLWTLDVGLACTMNAVLGAAAAGVAAAAAGALHSRRAAWVAGLLQATAGAFVFQDVIPGQEPALTLLFAAALLAAVRLARSGAPATALLLGALAGVATMGRATSAALLLAAVPAVLAAAGRRRIVVAACCAAGFAAVLVPAAARNQSVAGAFTPFPWAAGPNLHMAQGPDSRRLQAFHTGELGADPRSIARNAVAVASRESGRALGPYEASEWWSRRAWRESGSAAEWAGHLGMKAGLFWSAEETGSNHWPLAERRFSAWLRVVPVHAWWLLAAGAAAWWLVRPGRPGADAAALVVAGTWMLLALSFPLQRLRVPAAALCAVLAGCAVAEVLRGRRDARRLAVAAAIGLLATAAAFVPFREEARGLGHVNLAVAHARAGDGAGAVRAELERALAVEPDCGLAYEGLGRLAFDEGDPQGALRWFEKALRDRRSAWRANVWALEVLASIGRADEAEAAAQRMMAERPADPDLLACAAVVALTRGDRPEAERRLAAARAADPGSATVQRVAAIVGLRP